MSPTRVWSRQEPVRVSRELDRGKYCVVTVHFLGMTFQGGLRGPASEECKTGALLISFQSVVCEIPRLFQQWCCLSGAVCSQDRTPRRHLCSVGKSWETILVTWRQQLRPPPPTRPALPVSSCLLCRTCPFCCPCLFLISCLGRVIKNRAGCKFQIHFSSDSCLIWPGAPPARDSRTFVTHATHPVGTQLCRIPWGDTS